MSKLDKSVMASDLFVSNGNKGEEEEKERVREGIISSLPKCNGWITQHLYLYQGFWSRAIVLKGMISVQEQFKARSTDIFLATPPKCGTTWLKALAFAIVNRAKYPNFLPESQPEPHPLLTSDPQSVIHTMEYRAFRNKDFLAEIENQPSPRLCATHMPYTSLPGSILSSGCRIIYLYRNPQDMLVSFWHFMGKFKVKEIPRISLEEAFESFCRGESQFGPYWDHVLGYYDASLKRPDRILLLKYEDMHGDTYNHVKRLAEFVGYPFSMEEEAKGVVQDIIQFCSFENMRNLEVNKQKVDDKSRVDNDAFFRKGQVGDAKNYLTAEMIERLERITEEKFQGSGLSHYKLQ